MLAATASASPQVTGSGLVPATRKRSWDAGNALSQTHRRQLAPFGSPADSGLMPPEAIRSRCGPGHPEARAGKALVVNVARGENVLEQGHAGTAQAIARRFCPAGGASRLLDVMPKTPKGIDEHEIRHSR